MSYVNSVLGKDESIEYKAVVSLLPFIPRFIFGLILIGGGVFVFYVPMSQKIFNVDIEKIISVALIFGAYQF